MTAVKFSTEIAKFFISKVLDFNNTSMQDIKKKCDAKPALIAKWFFETYGIFFCSSIKLGLESMNLHAVKQVYEQMEISHDTFFRIHPCPKFNYITHSERIDPSKLREFNASNEKQCEKLFLLFDLTKPFSYKFDYVFEQFLLTQAGLRRGNDFIPWIQLLKDWMSTQPADQKAEILSRLEQFKICQVLQTMFLQEADPSKIENKTTFKAFLRQETINCFKTKLGFEPTSELCDTLDQVFKYETQRWAFNYFLFDLNAFKQNKTELKQLAQLKVVYLDEKIKKFLEGLSGYFGIMQNLTQGLSDAEEKPVLLEWLMNPTTTKVLLAMNLAISPVKSDIRRNSTDDESTISTITEDGEQGAIDIELPLRFLLWCKNTYGIDIPSDQGLEMLVVLMRRKNTKFVSEVIELIYSRNARLKPNGLIGLINLKTAQREWLRGNADTPFEAFTDLLDDIYFTKGIKDVHDLNIFALSLQNPQIKKIFDTLFSKKRFSENTLRRIIGHIEEFCELHENDFENAVSFCETLSQTYELKNLIALVDEKMFANIMGCPENEKGETHKNIIEEMLVDFAGRLTREQIQFLVQYLVIQENQLDKIKYAQAFINHLESIIGCPINTHLLFLLLKYSKYINNGTEDHPGCKLQQLSILRDQVIASHLDDFFIPKDLIETIQETVGSFVLQSQLFDSPCSRRGENVDESMDSVSDGTEIMTKELGKATQMIAGLLFHYILPMNDQLLAQGVKSIYADPTINPNAIDMQNGTLNCSLSSDGSSLEHEERDTMPPFELNTLAPILPGDYANMILCQWKQRTFIVRIYGPKNNTRSVQVPLNIPDLPILNEFISSASEYLFSELYYRDVGMDVETSTLYKYCAVFGREDDMHDTVETHQDAIYQFFYKLKTGFRKAILDLSSSGGIASRNFCSGSFEEKRELAAEGNICMIDERTISLLPPHILKLCRHDERKGFTLTYNRRFQFLLKKIEKHQSIDRLKKMDCCDFEITDKTEDKILSLYAIFNAETSEITLFVDEFDRAYLTMNYKHLLRSPDLKNHLFTHAALLKAQIYAKCSQGDA